MHELLEAKNIVKPPKGKHSVKGVGTTYPNPKETKVLEDGVQVPLGKPVSDPTVKGSLLYNEYPFNSFFLSSDFILRFP